MLMVEALGFILLEEDGAGARCQELEMRSRGTYLVWQLCRGFVILSAIFLGHRASTRRTATYLAINER